MEQTGPMAPSLDVVRELVTADHGLAVVVTQRADGTPHASVVNAGVLAHPRGGEPVVGFVTPAGTVKIRHLRLRPRATVVFRAGWRWASVEGDAQLAGPDDRFPGLDADGIRLLLREIFTAAGGHHDDFDEYDRVMAAERRTAVLVQPSRIRGSA